MLKRQELHKIHIGGDKDIRLDNESGSAVLLLHGFTSSPLVFQKMAEYFASQGFGVYAPVIAGHGSTAEDLGNSTIDDWKKSVESAYLELSSKYQKIFVVGNSFGGNLGIWLASKYDVTGLVCLGTPVWLRYHQFIKFRLWLYGWAKKYYHKPKWNIKLEDCRIGSDRSYPVIPIKSLNAFIYFVEKETVSGLGKIQSPSMVIQSLGDRVVHPKSAKRIYNCSGCAEKSIHFVDGNIHNVVSSSADSQEVFRKINNFFNQIIKAGAN
jgi:carboxylesterase